MPIPPVRPALDALRARARTLSPAGLPPVLCMYAPDPEPHEAGSWSLELPVERFDWHYLNGAQLFTQVRPTGVELRTQGFYRVETHLVFDGLDVPTDVTATLVTRVPDAPTIEWQRAYGVRSTGMQPTFVHLGHQFVVPVPATQFTDGNPQLEVELSASTDIEYGAVSWVVEYLGTDAWASDPDRPG